LCCPSKLTPASPTTGLLGVGDADLIAASRPLADVLADLSAD
jgi:hypothetical protein